MGGCGTEHDRGRSLGFVGSGADSLDLVVVRDRRRNYATYGSSDYWRRARTVDGKFTLVHAACDAGAKRARKFVFTRSRRCCHVAVVLARFAACMVDCRSAVRWIVPATGTA